jgi:serine/threonine-protein kinase HipA
LLVTRQLTRDESAVTEMFRRTCFNVFAHNRDDHTKNFAFLMDEDGIWRPSPSYDLTFSAGPGGEHTLLVGTEGRNPTKEHLLALAKAVGIKSASAIVDDVRAAVVRFAAISDEVELPKTVRDRVASALNVSIRVPTRRTRAVKRAKSSK